jgi:homospermidine synthase
VSWLVKEALVNLCTDLEIDFKHPQTREEWAQLMQKSGVKGIHIAERDTQRTFRLKQQEIFFNTWSVEGIIAEGIQPSELGWGTHEKWVPPNAKFHDTGCQSSIYLMQAGANTRVHSWCPTPGPQYGFLISHNEAISIADYFTVGAGRAPAYRPTVNYAYHPCNHAVLSIFEMFGGGEPQEQHHLLDETEIVSGQDELGVLLYGHAKNAYWYGSQLTIEQTRRLAPYQNATGLQVTSGVLAGMAWALENQKAGIVEADEMDYKFCLDVQRPYLGTVKGYYTDWTPLDSHSGYFPVDIDKDDPWQFRNILVRQGV